MGRKLSPTRLEKLARVHRRDCPARHNVEFGPCIRCMEFPVESIVAVAVVFDNTVWTLPPPARHHDVIRKHANETGGPGSGNQGFLTSLGRIVSRVEAGHIAIAAGQIETLRWPPELYSEDMW